MADLEKQIDKALADPNLEGWSPRTGDAPWRIKADRLIFKLSQQSSRQAQRSPRGARYKRHHQYSVPDLARQLVECLNTNDEHRAKALFLSYDGMKAIGGKRRSAAPSRAQFKSLLSKAKRYIASHKGGKRRHSDSDVVDVMFRVVKAGAFKGDVDAWFPGLPGTDVFDMTVYAHVGQHSTGDPQYMRTKTRPAKRSEYAALKRELESPPFNYKLRVVQKATAKHARQRRAADR
jgi:hypothetical protein